MARSKTVHHKMINIGYMGERFEKEVKSFSFKEEIDGKVYKFVVDHEQESTGARWGRWVEPKDYVNG